MPNIHPIQPILVVILAAVLWYIKRKPAASPASGGRGNRSTSRATGQKPAKTKESPEALEHQHLRQQALQTKREALGLPAVARDTDNDEVYGLLMEMEIAGSVVTLVGFANGDARIYYQTGGGMVGGAAQVAVRKAAKELISLGQKALPRMVRATTQPLPEPGKIRFYALTARGILTTETDRATLGQPNNGLSSLFYAGQEVVSQMREAQAEAPPS